MCTQQGQRSKEITTINGEDDDGDDVWQTLLQLEEDISRDLAWNSENQFVFLMLRQLRQFICSAGWAIHISWSKCCLSVCLPVC